MNGEPIDTTSIQLRHAYYLIREGRKGEALALLRPITEQHPNHVKAWWLVANALDEPDKIQKALIHVLRLEPSHKGASQKLAQLNAGGEVQPSKAELQRREAARLKAKQEAEKRRQRGLRFRLIALIVIFVGIGAVNCIQGRCSQWFQAADGEAGSTPTPASTADSTFTAPNSPPEFVDSAYFPDANYDYSDEMSLPCDSWTVNGRVDGFKVGMIVRAFNEGGVDVTAVVSSLGGYELQTPPQPNGAINVYLYDFVGSPPLSGLNNVRLETATAPTCGVTVNFNR